MVVSCSVCRPLQAGLNDANTTLTGLYLKVKAMPRISGKNQVTLPVESLEAAGLQAGDEVVIAAEGKDLILIRRAQPDLEAALGVFDGLFEPGYLDKLRSEERG
jgi:bifunctional DNA-binding transcriptional regulator/antitoxin component of YhaV-PrlF toxin-antitoxin module